MKRKFLRITLALLPLLAQPAFALDKACDPVIHAIEKKMAQPAWHINIQMPDSNMEAIKLGDTFFMHPPEGSWVPSPNLDQAEKIVLGQMQSGEMKVTECRDEGRQTINGNNMNVTSYKVEVSGLPQPTSLVKLYTGVDDGLPYLQTSDGGYKTIYRYTDVTAPDL